LDVLFNARNDAGVGVFRVEADDWDWSDATQSFTWQLSSPQLIADETSGAPVATILSARVAIFEGIERRMEINLGIVAGDSATVVDIDFPQLAFDRIPEYRAEARASASFTVTDVDLNGAFIRGDGPEGIGAFRATSVDRGVETPFTDLVNFVFVGGGGTANGSQNDPSFGFRPVGSNLDAMNVQLAFLVTANDLVFATNSVGVSNPPVCPGDANGDNQTNLSDLELLLSSFGSCAGDSIYDQRADLNVDDCVGFDDLAEMLSAFGTVCD